MPNADCRPYQIWGRFRFLCAGVSLYTHVGREPLDSRLRGNDAGGCGNDCKGIYGLEATYNARGNRTRRSANSGAGVTAVRQSHSRLSENGQRSLEIGRALGARGKEEAHSPAQVHGRQYDREEDGGCVSAEEADDNCAKH